MTTRTDTQPSPHYEPAPDLRTPITTDCLAVVGLQWGDEGKGKVIDRVSPRYDAVVRYNGGANAGHSVVFDGTRHALHLVPSGIFSTRTRAVIGPGVVVDPFTLIDELERLAGAGVDVSNLVLSDRAHLVMPYHKEEDASREVRLDDPGEQSTTGASQGSIGTTRRGIGPAYAEKAMRSAAVRAGDLLRPDVLRERLRIACDFKKRGNTLIDAPPTALDADHLFDELTSIAPKLEKHLDDTTYLLHAMLRDDKRLLFEGANATLLDVDHGTFPFVTSSSTTALGISSGAGVPGRCIGETLGVVKAYSTRVGAGPMPTELNDQTGDAIRERGNEFGTTTGRPRRCGWLDLVAVRYAAMLNGCTGLAIMLLDVLAGFDELRV
ncbi:MAG: adenylosuccinate synthase, partial [Planctomycetota bacterium]